VAVDDAAAVEAAKSQLATVLEEWKEDERGIRKGVHDWVYETDEKIRKQNVEILKPARAERTRAISAAKHKADAEANRKSNAEVAHSLGAAANAARHAGRYRREARLGAGAGAAHAAAAADARSSHAAGKDLKSAKRATAVAMDDARRTAHHRDAMLMKDIKGLHRFAIESLEKAW